MMKPCRLMPASSLLFWVVFDLMIGRLLGGKDDFEIPSVTYQDKSSDNADRLLPGSCKSRFVFGNWCSWESLPYHTFAESDDKKDAAYKALSEFYKMQKNGVYCSKVMIRTCSCPAASNFLGDDYLAGCWQPNMNKKDNIVKLQSGSSLKNRFRQIKLVADYDRWTYYYDASIEVDFKQITDSRFAGVDEKCTDYYGSKQHLEGEMVTDPACERPDVNKFKFDGNTADDFQFCMDVCSFSPKPCRGVIFKKGEYCLFIGVSKKPLSSDIVSDGFVADYPNNNARFHHVDIALKPRSCFRHENFKDTSSIANPVA